MLVDRLYHFAVLGLLLLVVSSCGFQLRGQAQLPAALQVVYIEDNTPPTAPPSPLAGALKDALEAQEVTVTSDPQEATATLVILHEEILRRTLATGPEGEVREYTLRYDISFAVNRAEGTVLIPKEDLNFSRDLLYSETQVLGRAAGEELVIRDMVADAAWTIIRRLEAAGR